MAGLTFWTRFFAAAAVLMAVPAGAAPIGMVDKPCEPLPPAPASVEAFNTAFLQPGKADLPTMIALTKDPAYVAYDAARVGRNAQDPNGLCNYAEANADLLRRGGRPKMVFIGDSITENWARADPSLFADGRIVGRGVGGQTSAQMVVRFHADVVALRPRTVQIMAGTNDIAGNGGPTSERAYQDNIMAMVEMARAHHIKVVLASIPPAERFLWSPQLRPAPQIQRLNAWLRAYARREGLVYADYYARLATPQGGMRPGFAIDGVHPNRDAYAQMRPLIADLK